MAEFKLGRIRFVWKGDWATSTTYYKDDVVALGGKIYICVLGHESASDFFTDLDIVPTKWNLVSDGQTWKGDWLPQTEYVYNDIVKYGARLYICQTIHTSADDSTIGLEADLDKWQPFAEGIDWKGNWDTDTVYNINDLVKYGGSTYVCTDYHTSAQTTDEGLELDSDKWVIFNQGFDYLNGWTALTRYKINDVVRYGAGLWISTASHTSTADFGADSANWEKFVEGFQFEDEWDIFKAYQPGDVVRYGGNQYIAKTDHNGSIPPSTAADWSLFSEGLRFLGDWAEDSSAYEYKVGEVVRLGGYTYRCVQDHQNQQPPNPTYWERLNSGFEWRGEWVDDREYFAGDVVRYGDNSYVCLIGHISEGDDGSSLGGAIGSRPDLADSGQYWSILAIGAEQSVLTTKGDLVYYSGTAPTRLPIGLDGQVLQVNNNKVPEWAFLGATEDVYYVAEHGRDEPAPVYGKSIDRPWKSIRYATLQIERGTKNPDAAKLLEINRRFIQREIIEWTDYQIANAGVGDLFENFSYDSFYCERDMGLIVDALIWDITHGGNVKSREAALRYVNNASGVYTKDQEAETVASINYGLSVIEAVLNQTAPSVNYQTTNGDNSTAIVAQYFNDTLSAEDVLTEIQDLTKIITDAITAGVTTNIPARLIRNTLIKVSTGKYYEVLPITVPAECCIIGDELRATTISPRKKSNGTLTPKNDFKYTFKALERMENIVGDIVTGSSVTPTTGNTTVQVQDWPFAETTVVAPQVEKLSRVIRKQIDSEIGNKLEAQLPKHYNAADTENARARDLILLNKEFIQEEVIALIADANDGYPDLKYSKTKCKQDVGFILDAIAYDLTFGGNWQSVVAGDAYYNGTSGTLQISATEKQPTLDAYGYMKGITQTIGRNITVSPTYQTSVTQISGTGGDLAAATTIGALFDNIIAIVTNGAGTESITYPTISNADANTAIVALDNVVETVKTDTIDFISKNFGSFRYNSATCRRDLTNILTDIAYDIAFGTNYNAIFSGIAYQRPTNAYNIAQQRTETVGAIRHARDLVEAALSGSPNAILRSDASFNEIVDIIINGTAGTAAPGDGVVDAISYPIPSSLPTTNAEDAFDNIRANVDFIKAEIVAWINNEIADGPGSSGNAIWDGFVYDATKCERDVGYIVDAMSYDILYGGTQATTRIAESYFGINGDAYPANQAAQTAAAYDRLATVLDQIVREASVTVTSGNTELQTTLGTPATSTEGNALLANMQIIEDVLTAGNTNSLPAAVYPSISWATSEFTDAKTTVDTEQAQIILDVIQYINTTYNDFNYNHAKCKRDIGLILKAAEYDFGLGSNFASIVSAYSYLRAPSSNVLSDQKAASIAAFEYARQQFIDAVPVGSQYDFVRTGINSTWEWVDDIIHNGSGDGSNFQVEDVEVYNAIRQLELNKEFIVDEVTSYVDEYFKDTVTGMATDGNITISDTSWLDHNMAIKFVAGDDSTNGVANSGLTENATYYVSDITSDTTFTISSTLGGAALTFIEFGDDFDVVTAYEYNRELCSRDVREFVDAIKYDLTWPSLWKREYTDSITFYRPGSYSTRLAARYYANAVLGSQEEDMFYLRNGTGVRNCTLDGLQGDLGPANAYGTSRPTAGAYCSLDPGWGPDDQRAWITARSPYIQGVTTFGYGATGQRIDGALHNGGNDSMVSNDFTQVISDGIGAHILNNGRAELVSVFTYYSHIGYLAESGGRIRATNGNNSYGDFGSVAEGVDPFETPVTSLVDNSTQYNATIGLVNTDADQLLSLEYTHAGNDYTEAVIDFFGPGDNEEVIVDEFRDNAIIQGRVVSVDDSTGNPDSVAGGSGYTIVTNTAQAGSTTSITLSATDGNINSAYPGMRVQVTGGAGNGLYGIINTYNSGSKVATVLKRDVYVDATQTANAEVFMITELGNTDWNAIGASTVPYVGEVFTANGAGSGTGKAIKLVDGWDHVVSGTTFEAPNSTSTYEIEPRAAFSTPPKTSTSRTGQSNQYSDITYFETSAEYTNITPSTESDGLGATFDVTRIGEKYYVSLNQAGAGYARNDLVTIHGTNVGGTTPLNDVFITITTVNTTTGAVIDFDFTGVAQKGLYVAIPGVAGSTAGQTSVDGVTWSAQTLPSPGGTNVYSSIATGLIDDGSSLFKQSVAIAVSQGGSNAEWSYDGATWNSVALPGTFATAGATEVAFGQTATTTSRFVAISENDQDVVYSDNGGQSWATASNALPSTGYNAMTYGKGRFVALRTGTANSSYSEDGIIWSAGANLPSANWVDLAWGNGRFVAISDTTQAAYSLDGGNWVSVTLPTVAGGTPSKIAYGQGVFVIAYTFGTSGGTVLYSEDGIVWTAFAATSVASGYNAITFGNPDRTGRFIALRNAVSTDVEDITIGAHTQARASVANEQVFAIRLTEPGSGYVGVTPEIEIIDPNNINDVVINLQVGDGALANPTFVNRGSGFISASATVNDTLSNGKANFFQDGSFIAVRRLSARPVNGSNIEFDSLPGQFFKLVNTVSFLGTNDGSYTAFLQISPQMEIYDAPPDGDPVTMRIRFSQVRLTGHDFLDIGTGNFTKTNYPGTPTVDPDQNKETTDSDGGRVFFTATDQDGNFRVGDLFSIEQATGVATLDAEAFNIAGLQELSLGEVTLGGNSASITEFSTDPFFTANSDTIVPTQRAIKAYIESQIGGGGASLNVNSVTAGDIFISTDTITTVSGSPININANVVFTGSVLGLPLAYNYFLR